jgi:hypothetical protein
MQDASFEDKTTLASNNTSENTPFTLNGSNPTASLDTLSMTQSILSRMSQEEKIQSSNKTGILKAK